MEGRAIDLAREAIADGEARTGSFRLAVRRSNFLRGAAAVSGLAGDEELCGFARVIGWLAIRGLSSEQAALRSVPVGLGFLLRERMRSAGRLLRI